MFSGTGDGSRAKPIVVVDNTNQIIVDKNNLFILCFYVKYIRIYKIVSVPLYCQFNNNLKIYNNEKRNKSN